MVCPNCGAPLPPSVASSPFVICTYCRATSNVEDRSVTQRQELPPDAPAEDLDAGRRQALSAFYAELMTQRERHPIAYATFAAACQRHLQSLGATEAVARVSYNLALDYEQETGSQVLTQGASLARLTEAYMAAVKELRNKAEYEIDMPFFLATEKGPLHYRRKLDVPTIIALSEREPPAAPEKKGFFAKLFG